MAYVIDDNKVGWQQIADTDTVQRHALGMRVKATDPVFGQGEFVYLVGIGSTVVGSCVAYSTGSWITALAPVGTALPRSVAFAMSANVASQYGWYQISGLAVAKKALATSLAAAAAVAVKTIGLVSATASLKEIEGALVSAVSSAASAANKTTVVLAIDRPQMQGRVS